MVDAARLAVFVDDEVFGAVDETERGGVQRAIGLALFSGAVGRRERLGERRLITERAGRVDRAEQQLQQVQRAAGVKAVAVRADPAHRVHADRTADHLAVFAAMRIGPGDRQFDRIVERGLGEFAGDAADRIGGNAAAFADRVGRVLRVEVAFDQQMEHRHGAAAVGQDVFAYDGGGDVDGVGGAGAALTPALSRGRERGFFGGIRSDVAWRIFGCMRCIRSLRNRSLSRSRERARVRAANPTQRTPQLIASKQPIVRAARIADHQPMRIRIAHQVIQIDPIGLQQLVDQREREQAIGPRPDPDPLVGDRAIAAAHRIDRDDLRAARLQLAQAELDRIGIVILGHAPQHQVTRMLPVGFAEFPERAAQRVQPARGHVDRAEPAVRGVVDRAELLRPPAGQRLRLIAAGEERQFVGIAFADRPQPAGGDAQRFVPFDFAELALAAFAHAQ